MSPAAITSNIVASLSPGHRPRIRSRPYPPPPTRPNPHTITTRYWAERNGLGLLRRRAVDLTMVTDIVFPSSTPKFRRWRRTHGELEDQSISIMYMRGSRAATLDLAMRRSDKHEFDLLVNALELIVQVRVRVRVRVSVRVRV